MNLNVSEKTNQATERALLLGLHFTGNGDSLSEAEHSLAELDELARAAGVEVLGIAMQNRDQPDSAYAAGKGKLLELKELAERLSADTLILDTHLSGSQMRNINQLTDLRVLDRTMVILDIFARRAVTHEGCIQVEIAQLKDRATRLVGAGQVLSRLGGGIGTRGPGETQLETDRRHIQRRIRALENKLRHVRKRRQRTRMQRESRAVFSGAVVGYTNAGKSTLVNAICDTDLFTLDQVFATLDPTARRLKNSHVPIVLIDTVGFIRNLPHQLVEAFQATLEEVSEADFILQVNDLSDPDLERQMQVVEDQLVALEANLKPRIQVFSKCDLVEESQIERLARPERDHIVKVFVSAKDGRGLPQLIETIEQVPRKQMLPYHLLVPYSRSAIVSKLKESAWIEAINYRDKGIDVAFRIHASDLGIIQDLLR